MEFTRPLNETITHLHKTSPNLQERDASKVLRRLPILRQNIQPGILAPIYQKCFEPYFETGPYLSKAVQVLNDAQALPVWKELKDEAKPVQSDANSMTDGPKADGPVTGETMTDGVMTNGPGEANGIKAEAAGESAPQSGIKEGDTAPQPAAGDRQPAAGDGQSAVSDNSQSAGAEEASGADGKRSPSKEPTYSSIEEAREGGMCRLWIAILGVFCLVEAYKRTYRSGQTENYELVNKLMREAIDSVGKIAQICVSTESAHSTLTKSADPEGTSQLTRGVSPGAGGVTVSGTTSGAAAASGATSLAGTGSTAGTAGTPPGATGTGFAPSGGLRSDLLMGKCYFALSRLYGLIGHDKHLRNFLIHEYTKQRCGLDVTVPHAGKKSSAKSDSYGGNWMCESVLINELIHSYLDASEFDLALQFLNKTNFPKKKSTQQFVRYLFNIGRIQALRLEYSDSYDKLITSIKKIPNPNFAQPFKIKVRKFAIIVNLLMGEVPDVTVFNQPQTMAELAPYKEITMALRNGDVEAFQGILKSGGLGFQRDGTYELVERLHYSVVKARLKKINNAYARIPISDIAEQIGVSSTDEAEAMISKAILDGIVIGSIVDVPCGEGLIRCLVSKTVPTEYTSTGPSRAFDKRIALCDSMYKDAVKAMQYPDEDGLEVRAREAEKRRKAQQEALIRAEEDDYFEEDFDGM